MKLKVSFEIEALPDSNNEMPLIGDFEQEIEDSFTSIGETITGPIKVSQILIEEIG